DGAAGLVRAGGRPFAAAVARVAAERALQVVVAEEARQRVGLFRKALLVLLAERLFAAPAARPVVLEKQAGHVRVRVRADGPAAQEVFRPEAAPDAVGAQFGQQLALEAARLNEARRTVAARCFLLAVAWFLAHEVRPRGYAIEVHDQGADLSVRGRKGVS